MSLYTVYMQCSMYPESPVVNEDMCTRTLLCACMYMPCCLMTESSTYLMKPHVRKVRWSQALQMIPEKMNANTLYPCYNPPSYSRHSSGPDLPCLCTGISLNEVYFGALFPMKSECPWTPNQATMGDINEFPYPPSQGKIINILMKS